jgi:predicted DNA-binding transcriptional regulator YafY
VYRDVRALEEAGVPVIGEAGTGYKLMEGYKLPPSCSTRMKPRHYLRPPSWYNQKTDAGISKHYTSALDKIRAVLRLSEKDHLEEIDDHVMVMGHPAIVYQPPAELHLQSLLKAIGTSSVIDIKYFSIEKNETTQRKSGSPSVSITWEVTGTWSRFAD